MAAFRTETGLRLILVAIATASLSAILWQILTIAIANDAGQDPDRTWWLHRFVFPSLGWILWTSFGISGVAGLLIVETNRREIHGRHLGRWDAPRVAGLIAILTGGFLFASGTVMAFFYITEFQTLSIIRIGNTAGFALFIGLYLYWTAERLDVGAKTLRRVALLLGTVSIALGTMAAVALYVLRISFDPVTDLVLALSIPTSSVVSLIAWFGAYSGILGRLRTLNTGSLALA